MKNPTVSRIDVKTGIYDTEYTVRDYGTHIVVTAPYVRWSNNSGSLDFKKYKIEDTTDMQLIRNMIEMDQIYDDDSMRSMDDVINGF
jgi:hypothetical protein